MDGFFRNLPRLQTPRLLLRPLEEGDAEDLFAYASDPAVTEYLQWPRHQSLATTRAFLGRMMRAAAEDRPHPWALVLPETGRMIGTCGFNNLRPAELAAEIGFVLAADLWGRGLMTEAVRTVIAESFARTDLAAIEALCDPANTASARVLTKVGMTRRRSIPRQPLGVGPIRTMWMYIIDRPGPASH